MPVPHGCFRPLARELHRGEPCLHGLSIPVDEFRAFIRLLLFAQFGRPEVQMEELVLIILQAASSEDSFAIQILVLLGKCLIKILQQLSLSTHGMKLIQQPGLFTGLKHILTSVYTTSDSNSLANRLPQPTNITTLPVFAQLSTILFDTILFDHAKFHKSYNIHDTTGSSTRGRDYCSPRSSNSSRIRETREKWREGYIWIFASVVWRR